MNTIALEGLEFFAYHGYYKEEQKIGNKYGVDIEVSADFDSAARNDTLDETINYGILYKIVKKEMAVSSKLLENVALRIIEKTFSKYPHIKGIKVSVQKFNPPVGGICKSAKITVYKSQP